MWISNLKKSIGMLLGTACLGLLGSAAAAADVSASLPNAFVVMDANNPPSHESYVRNLKGEGHLMAFSADRRNDRNEYDFIKEKGAVMAGPIGAGTVASEIERLKKEMAKDRAGWKASYTVQDRYPWALPYDLCKGFEWNAKFEPRVRSPDKKPFVMHGISISCFFVGKSSAWVTSATVSENYDPELNQKLSPDFKRTATKILSSITSGRS